MTEILHANVFFFIASIATIVFAILICIAMYQVIKILRTVRTLLERIETGSDVIAEDLSSMRNFIMKGGFISHLMGMIVRPRPSGRARKTTKQDIIIEDSD